MARFFYLLIATIIFAGFAYWLNASGAFTIQIPSTVPVHQKTTTLVKENPVINTLLVQRSKAFIQSKKFNTDICFLIDMQISSSRKRFFIYDLKNDTILGAGLVTHGRCGERWLEGRKYSNRIGSQCTSSGHYKIGSSYTGRFGLAYKLFGLDSTNNNAFKRYVVLHAHECIPEKEVDYEICQSDGCPTVSPGFLKKLQPIIDQSPRPILLQIYDSGGKL